MHKQFITCRSQFRQFSHTSYFFRYALRISSKIHVFSKAIHHQLNCNTNFIINSGGDGHDVKAVVDSLPHLITHRLTKLGDALSETRVNKTISVSILVNAKSVILR